VVCTVALLDSCRYEFDDFMNSFSVQQGPRSDECNSDDDETTIFALFNYLTINNIHTSFYFFPLLLSPQPCPTLYLLILGIIRRIDRTPVSLAFTTIREALAYMSSLTSHISGVRSIPLFLDISACSNSKLEVQSIKPPIWGWLSSSSRNRVAFWSFPT
jgi:hypothetical protein